MFSTCITLCVMCITLPTLIYTIYLLYLGTIGNIRLTRAFVIDTVVLFIWTAICAHFSFGYLWTFISLMFGIYFVSGRIPGKFLAVGKKAVIITGCDMGLGRETAIKLDNLGMKVFAGCLFKGQEGEQTLVKACSDNLRTIQLDVTKVDQVEAAVEYVKKELGDWELWGIVNNAGILFLGNIETISQGDIQKILDVNYMGPVNMMKAFTTFIRRNKGRIVNVCSNAGLAPVRHMGAYCASKAALASLTETMRHELAPFGVNVSIIIPSGMNTGILRYDKQAAFNRWWAAASPEVQEDYGKQGFDIKSTMKTDEFAVLEKDLSLIANVVTDALLSKRPNSVYYKGILAQSVPFAYMCLPGRISDFILRRVLANWYQSEPNFAKKQKQNNHRPKKDD